MKQKKKTSKLKTDLRRKDLYLKDEQQFKRVLIKTCSKYRQVTLSPEYSQIVQEDTLHFLIMLARYKFIIRNLRKQDRVLDIGCGCGIGSIFLGQHCRSVVGLDTKKYEIDAAKSINQRDNVTFEMIDFFDYPRKEKYDVIVAIDVIEHMPKSKGYKFISKVAQHLSPNGMFAIGTPSRYSYKYQSELSKLGHIKLYSQEELATLMERYYKRVLSFSMNDEIVHTGFFKMAWYYFFLAFGPKSEGS